MHISIEVRSLEESTLNRLDALLGLYGTRREHTHTEADIAHLKQYFQARANAGADMHPDQADRFGRTFRVFFNDPANVCNADALIESLQSGEMSDVVIYNSVSLNTDAPAFQRAGIVQPPYPKPGQAEG